MIIKDFIEFELENIFLKNIVPYICFLKPILNWYITLSLQKC